jgi:predicted metalloprotease
VAGGCAGSGTSTSAIGTTATQLRRPLGVAVLDKLPAALRPAPNGSRVRYVGAEGLSVTAFLELVGTDASNFWQRSFAAAGFRWSPARQVVVGAEGAASECNRAARTLDAPLYCEHDDPPVVLLPVGWLERRAGPIGDFAYAFIVAHEWGHHVQKVAGLLAVRKRYPDRIFESHLELQADCLAGVWAFAAYEQGTIARGEIDQAIRLAASIADLPDVAPDDPGAHGKPAERARWFRRGFDTGRPSKCKTWTGTPPNPVR